MCGTWVLVLVLVRAAWYVSVTVWKWKWKENIHTDFRTWKRVAVRLGWVGYEVYWCEWVSAVRFAMYC